MKLRTVIEEFDIESKIDYSQSYVSLGSCFSAEIGNMMKERKFDTLVNPFGTVYNPSSICELIRLSLRGEMPASDTYLQKDDAQVNFKFHSDIKGLTKEELEHSIQASLTNVGERLKSSNWLFLTFGTAFVYKRIKNNDIVANCHKRPSKEFDRVLLPVQEIVGEVSEAIAMIRAENPDLKVLFTVSPVRHVRDTLEKNSLSKSILRVAVEQLISTHSKCFYFPSYEIMMDDLRDYRFYKEDMIHPTKQAVKYIWDAFLNALASKTIMSQISEVEKINAGLSHRPFNPNTESHRKFLKKLLAKIETFNVEGLDFTDEIKQIEIALEEI
ncbi:GSCFA domain-containing protein [Aureibacter tunicatorum]|uniref:GSCFA domain-containing protein n=1 Tax=Aureibacter tunicatorum TaxID=866807 RepID=A0AAE3XP51_9BACT|nr:GSCFA domain-containing protein [Aureibacter tunicatorum]MDR6239474.1 hypothetical protein [Aureibacter tunicatorum]BDD04604.1 hypothetical protein AUTU_20870 [Aureibacter tunicatorum]